VRILHTADWHVGKTLKGESRLDEHRAVLAEVVGVARDEAVDLALVAGDLFESAAPPPDAQRVVFDALLGLRSTGAKVVVIAGNHDNANAFEAMRPLMAALDVTLLGHATRPDTGGVVDHVTATGERARLALLPFVSQRWSVRAEQLLALDAAQAAGVYADRMRLVIEALCAGFRPDTVNVVVAHAMVRGGKLGGGERDAQTIFEYSIPATVFPASAHYVALGHLHRTQQLPAAAPVWYSGSPVQVDFGEEDDVKHVLLVEAAPGTPARVERRPIEAGIRLRTVRGTLAELEALAGTTGDDSLRVLVHEPVRAGLADEVRALLPRAVDVRIERDEGDGAGPGHDRADGRSRTGRTPHELFAEYLDKSGHARDERLIGLFARLLDEETRADAPEPA